MRFFSVVLGWYCGSLRLLVGDLGFSGFVHILWLALGSGVVWYCLGFSFLPSTCIALFLLVLDGICLYCLVLSCRIFSSPVLHCLIFSCLAWPCLALSGLVGRRLGLPCFIWPGRALPRRPLPWYSHLHVSCLSPSRLFSSTLCSRRFT